jgi:KipI family sensor histidine kinase inhibitor
VIPPRLSRYGQHALYIDWDLANAPNRATRTHALANTLRDRYPNADIIVGGGVIVVVGDVREEDVIAAMTGAAEIVPDHASRKTHFVPIVFDGPDLDDVSKTLQLPAPEILQSITSTDFVVEFLGFLPGFGYLGPLDSRLVLPRRPAPRPRVPAESLGIAGAFAGIYPFSSPGGWHLLGRAVDTKLFDPDRAEPFLFAPADHVRFESVDAPASISNESPRPASAPILADQSAFVVEFAPACATIQDAGRLGRLQSGMPPSGPLDPETLARANLAVGNHVDEAGLEIPLGRFAFRAKNDLAVSLDGEMVIHLNDGERFEVPETHRSVRYLAFRGGIDVPLVLGSRSTLLVARVGGFSGRPLRKGDVVGIADRNPKEMGAVFPRAHHEEEIVEVVVDPGPHLPRFPREALDVLLSSAFTISRIFDRVGMRFDGPKIPRSGGDSALPVPMIRGAMQIATDGTPIVFGPDHPTTGGYPVLAVVRRSSWGKLARQRAGRAVRFVVGK